MCPDLDLDLDVSQSGSGPIHQRPLNLNRLIAQCSVHHLYIRCIGGLPARGSVNGISISRSGALIVAAVGQEPRLGRWMRDGKAKNGIAVYRLEVRD